jgi:lipopolysaccharide exporter
MSAISFVEFVTMSLDTLLIGRLLGPAALGIYTRGGLLIGLPVYLLSSNIAKVVFPSFSQVQANRARLREVYLSSITLVAMLVTPVCAGAAVAAPEIVRVMLGEKWLAAVPILQVISITYVLSAVTMFAGVVCDATAALSRKLLLTLVCLGALAGLLYVGSRFGLVGVAWAMVGCELLRTALYSNIMRRELGAAPFAVLRAYGPGVLAGAGVAAAIAVVRFGMLALHAPALAMLVAEMLAGAAVLGALVLVRPPVQLRNVMRPLLARLGGGTGPAPARLLPRLLHALAARLERLAGAPPVVAPPTPALAIELEADAPAEPQPVHFSTAETELV